MKVGRQKNNPEMQDGREEIREMAEALSLYRSAMSHLAERTPVRPFAAERRPVRHLSVRLLLAPALSAAVAAAILIPLYHSTHHPVAVATRQATSTHQNPAALTHVDDTALMNQIDSELSQDVPDALEPLADLSDQPTNPTAPTEKNNVTHE